MRRYTIGAFVALLAAASVLAQSNVGLVRGTVKDPSGGVLPGVTVRLSRASDADRTTITDARGRVLIRRPSAGTVTPTSTRSPKRRKCSSSRPVERW